MVKLDRIYTRGGDKGMTSLGNGERVPKHDLRVEAFGAVDEANAAIGLARLHTAGTDLDAMLSRIQNDLFDLGADLCTPEDEENDPRRRPALRMDQVQVDRLEAEIDAMNANLGALTSFILPGGSPAAAYLHLARTITRRAERLVTALQDAERLNPAALSYINRLSDHLFVAARHANQDGIGDVLWVPGLNRG
ncbi:cob(I)yrinic acid a,c-diamide adenosyltransferase [Ferrovibrio terrae]|uniref:Corrinoid adenosyltransferase n=1 Tax=Ferrovibrio terrae TaxID=2594003 RepID=A0A516GWJ6_9PROT|nr:cob(I)yrinic acid a,c-diamide adenosyltransferase [Ferrovibrio terrae]QDO95872.1 cob(I)yrinic acid a,c-diamide adenosyltransferase [Ferrovibrio terrae]